MLPTCLVKFAFAGTRGDPTTGPRGSQEGAKSGPGDPKRAPREPQRAQKRAEGSLSSLLCFIGAFGSSSWTSLCSSWGVSWLILGLGCLGCIQHTGSYSFFLGMSRAILAPSWLLLSPSGYLGASSYKMILKIDVRARA